jgi:hypothetical protein
MTMTDKIGPIDLDEDDIEIMIYALNAKLNEVETTIGWHIKVERLYPSVFSRPVHTKRRRMVQLERDSIKLVLDKLYQSDHFYTLEETDDSED